MIQTVFIDHMKDHFPQVLRLDEDLFLFIFHKGWGVCMSVMAIFHLLHSPAKPGSITGCRARPKAPVESKAKSPSLQVARQGKRIKALI